MQQCFKNKQRNICLLQYCNVSLFQQNNKAGGNRVNTAKYKMTRLTEEQFQAGYEAAVAKAEELNESIREIMMKNNADDVEIYGIENEENLKEIEKAFYQATGQW
jgi:hypothetical protein